jgi:outer membrane murein-binding lipoprotein Lpp
MLLLQLRSMTTEELNQIRQVVREEVHAETEPIKSDLHAIKSDLHAVKQTQAQTNTTVAQIKTVVETLEAGQKDIRAEMATKAEVLHLGVKIDKLRKRVEGIEEYEGIHNPDKN